MSHWVPLLGTLLFLAVGFGWRTYVQWHRYGNSGFALFRSGSWPQHAREIMLFVLPLGLLAQALALALSPDTLAPYLILPAPAAGMRLWLGTALLCAGTVLMAVAQLDLGASWRIGIDACARPGLVTDGFYRVSRNPIYLAMFVTLFGFALLVPTWVSAVLVLATVVGVRRQVLEEETYLTRTYGDAYHAYTRRVGRFLPGVGRLS